ncbi:MAG: Fe-S cluster assembly protein SufD [Geminicoccaceae bacterium]
MALANRTLKPGESYERAFSEASPRLPGAKLAELSAWRQASFARFAAAGVPTPRVEAWKYTNVSRLASTALALAGRPQVRLDELTPHLLGGTRARRLIFVNGQVAPELCHVESLPAGLRASSLARALEQDPARVSAILRGIEDERAFTALNDAFAGAGSWVELDEGVTVEEPLQLLFLTVGRDGPAMAHPRIVVRLGRGARLRLIESHVALDDAPMLTNLVSQIDLAQGAVLELDRIEQVGAQATHLGKSYVRQEAGSRLAQTVATLGGGLVRNETEARLEGSGIECILNGVYLARGKEHVDNLIRIHHMAPSCHSDQFYKGVIDEAARAVFAGKIIVHRDAQKTNAYQKNDNLLLSDEAEIDTKPELEIYADDVKCSHGATSGDLDPLALFYLRSRGLPRATAETVLTFAFAAEVIERFADASVRHRVREVALGRLPGGGDLAELA